MGNLMSKASSGGARWEGTGVMSSTGLWEHIILT